MSKLQEKIRSTVAERAFQSPQGLERLLDLHTLERGEFLIFCRKGSLLSHKITERLTTRSPEEELKATINALKRGYCSACWELVRNCKCPDGEFWV